MACCRRALRVLTYVTAVAAFVLLVGYLAGSAFVCGLPALKLEELFSLACYDVAPIFSF